MINLRLITTAILLALFMAACGGGGGSATATPPVGGGVNPGDPGAGTPAPVVPPAPNPAPAPAVDPFAPPVVPGTAPVSYTIKGVISVAETAEVDSDTNDPNSVYKSNDTPSRAQSVNNPSLLVGHLTFKGQGPTGPNRTQGDLADYYKVRLTAGQVVELEFSSDPADIDIDLFITKASGTGIGTIVGQSTGESRYECVRVATTGDYYISAEVYEASSVGDTVYQMRISAPGGSSNCSNATADGGLNIIAGQILAKPITSNPMLKSASVSAAMAQMISPDIENRIGPALYEMPIANAVRAQGLSLTAKSAVQAKSVAAQGVSYASEKNPELTPESLAVLQTIAYAKAMSRSGQFEYAFPNFRVKTFQTTTTVGVFPPNDREYARQRWHYDMISLPAAMNTLAAMPAQPTRRPIVAVVDTGIVKNHPDLAGNIIAGYDFVSSASVSGDGNGIDSDPDDTARASTQPSFHGSHVAGTVGAVTFNGTGGAGVAPMARLMPIRVLGEGGSGSFSDILQGILFAARLTNSSGTLPPERADVINLSLGGSGTCPSQLRDVFDQVRAQGTVVVIASGNESQDNVFTPVGMPANCAGVIAVAAVNATRGRAFYSNVGPENAIAAPGGDVSKSTTGTGDPDGIFSTVASFQGGVRVPTYTHLMGTSMATPHVAGVVALMRWVNPNLTVAQIDTLIRGGTISDDLGAVGKDNLYGAGLINAKRAVDAAIASLGAGGPTPTPTPTPSPPPVAGQIEPSPASISFGSTRTSAEIVLRRVGTTTERVVSVISTLASVTVAPKPGAVDANGLGTYVVTLNRSALVAAAFAQINVTTNTRTIGVPVNADRRDSNAPIGTYGPVYILAFDADKPDDPAIAGSLVANPVNGEYSYSVTIPGTTAKPAPSKVVIFAGGDTDNNGNICARGEACGAYPSLGANLEVIQARNPIVDGISFSVTPFGGINSGSAASLSVPTATAPSNLIKGVFTVNVDTAPAKSKP
jgi:serine protease